MLESLILFRGTGAPTSNDPQNNSIEDEYRVCSSGGTQSGKFLSTLATLFRGDGISLSPILSSGDLKPDFCGSDLKSNWVSKS